LADAAFDRPDTPAERHVRSAELLAVQRTLRGIGINMNQLAKVANARGFVPSHTANDLAELRTILERVEAVGLGSVRQESP
jgi:hypothetical protein